MRYTCTNCNHTGTAGPLYGNESCYECTGCEKIFCVKCIRYVQIGNEGAASLKPFCHACAAELEAEESTDG